MMLSSHPELTFKHNMKRGRHGWVRLTPAYSESLVRTILQQHPHYDRILEPFGGTGTTALVASELSRDCDLLDINPFLIWLAQAKCANYTPDEIAHANQIGYEMMACTNQADQSPLAWLPPISHIERWWDSSTQIGLSQLLMSIQHSFPNPSRTQDLLLIAFCQLIMDVSYASFQHQSVSFKNSSHNPATSFSLSTRFYQRLIVVLQTASQAISGRIRATLSDSRTLIDASPSAYSAVITSPPYVNRMSYIRELRPYMYWLGYLTEARQAGELDWLAIGGTWGIATSRLKGWSPPDGLILPDKVYEVVERIQQHSPTLANYVHKYFVDISIHFTNLYPLLVKGGRLYYVVGNSKFYDTLVPAEAIYAMLMQMNGFVGTHIEVIRKRSSKKELYEFLITAHKD